MQNDENSKRSQSESTLVIASIGFVLLWSTGFIGARLGLPYADPFSFLGLRLFAAAMVLSLLAWLARVEWPRGMVLVHTIISGQFIHSGYLGGVFIAIWLGCPPAIAALITGMQPLLTSLIARIFLREHLTKRIMIGLVIGFLGLIVVLSDRLYLEREQVVSLLPVLFATFSISIGTIYQKRFFGATDIRAGIAVQYFFCALVFGLLFAIVYVQFWLTGNDWILQRLHIEWSLDFTIAFLWLTFGLSVIAIGLFFILIRKFSSARVSSLMYLVPPTTAIEAWLLFGDKLSLAVLLGMVLIIVALILVSQQKQREIVVNS